MARKIEGHSDSVEALAVLPDGRLASGSQDGTMRFWDRRTGVETARLENENSIGVYKLAVLQDGRLASIGGDSAVCLWDPKTGAKIAQLGRHSGPIDALVVLPDGRLALGFRDDTIRLWTVKRGRLQLALFGAETARLEDSSSTVGAITGVNALAMLPDGWLASGHSDNTIRLWNLKVGWLRRAWLGAETARLEGHTNGISALAALPDGLLASGSWDNTVRIWNPQNRKEIAGLEVDSPVSSIVALSGGRIVAGDKLGRLYWLQLLK